MAVNSWNLRWIHELSVLKNLKFWKWGQFIKWHDKSLRKFEWYFKFWKLEWTVDIRPSLIRKCILVP